MVYPVSYPIVFFDGECGICNHTVQFLMAKDRAKSLRYAPLQGETALARLGPAAAKALDTLYFCDQTGTYSRSSAALRIAAYLPAPWSLLSWLRIIPRPLRDFCYNAVAKRRKLLLGEHTTCGLLKPDERALFLP